MKSIFQEEHEENDGDFYNESYLEESMDGDGISSEEAGFMMGYLS